MNTASRSPRRTAVLGLVLAAVVAPAFTSLALADTATAATTPRTVAATKADALQAPAGPGQVLVRDAGAVVARFTTGSRTVVLAGPSRTFAEPGTTRASVTTTAWVRLLDAPFTGTVDAGWLGRARADRSADVLARATSFLPGAPTVRDAAGTLVSSDASYGPLQADGTREEGSDWNDYQQVTGTYPTGTDRPEARQAGALDCSGFVRLVFGTQGTVPLTLDPATGALPRRAVQMAAAAPASTVLPNRGTRPASLAALQPGDLLFFDAATDDGTAIDHVAIHLGNDSAGKPRFVSSRKKADGPTMGDVGGASLLSGKGLYATSFRAAARL